MKGEFNYEYASLRPKPPTGGPDQATDQPGATRPYSSSAFRILKLLPGINDQAITCNLLVRRLRHTLSEFPEPEQYDALSYHWGDPSAPETISILANDYPYSKKIGRQLYGALRQFRDHAMPIYLWVDALCINQEDRDEKSVQIPLMRRIYGNAKRVRVWLGPASADSDLAMKFVQQCLDELERFDERVEQPKYAPNWAALSTLIRRRWFSRRWIIQEIALSNEATVHCGSSKVDWQCFASVIKMVSRKAPELRKLFQQSEKHKNHPDFLGDLSELGAIRLADIASHLFRRTAEGKITERKFSLEALMSSLTAFEASDPHDVLYAVLWLARDAHPVTNRAPKFGNVRASGDNHSDYDPFHSPTATTVGSSLPPSPQKPNFGLLEGSLETELQARAPDASLLSPLLQSGRKRSNSDRSKASSRPSSAHSNTSQAFVPSGLGLGPPESSTDAEPPTKRPKLDVPSLNVITTGSTKQEEREARAWSLLTAGMSHTRIVVDYEKPILEVYKDFLGLAIRHSSSLDMICKPWAPSLPNKEKLPSWIPQLARSPFSRTKDGIHRRVNADSLVKRLGHHGTGQKPYNAAKGYPPRWRFGEQDGNSLFAEGFVLDTVKEKKKPAEGGSIPQEWLSAGGWLDTEQPPPEIFWRTLVGNIDSEGMFAPIYWSYICHNAVTRRTEEGPVNTNEILHDCPSLVKEFLERMQRMIWLRRLVLLDKLSKQSLALAPEATKTKDLICILAGCSVPVVLRRIPPQELEPSSSTNSSAPATRVAYQFIGECYVHDMMDGEAIDFRRKVMKKSGDTKMFQEFDLR